MNSPETIRVELPDSPTQENFDQAVGFLVDGYFEGLEVSELSDISLDEYFADEWRRSEIYSYAAAEWVFESEKDAWVEKVISEARFQILQRLEPKTALQPIEAESVIPAKLDVAQRALAEATEDWQRVDIRNYAAALAAATAILNRKDIQVQAANLVQDAERAIAKANPPKTPKESGAKKGHFKEPSLLESEPIIPLHTLQNKCKV